MCIRDRLAATLVAITFASCKKDRTCACTTSTVDSGTNYFTSFNSSTGSTYQDSDPISDVQTSTDEVSFEKISKKYNDLLFRKNETCYFNINKQLVFGQIESVNKFGLLKVLIGNELQEFAHKELEMII